MFSCVLKRLNFHIVMSKQTRAENVSTKQPPAVTATQRDARISDNYSTTTTTTESIYCLCNAPKFEIWPKCCGFITCIGAGTGLECCWCYGKLRDDWKQVCIAGLLMQISSPCLYGIGAGCLVGMRMMGCCLQEQKK